MLAFTVNNTIGRWWLAWGCRGLLVQMAGVSDGFCPAVYRGKSSDWRIASARASLFDAKLHAEVTWRSDWMCPFVSIIGPTDALIRQQTQFMHALQIPIDRNPTQTGFLQ